MSPATGTHTGTHTGTRSGPRTATRTATQSGTRSRLRALARFVWPGQGGRAYLRAIRAAGAFDRRFYLDSNPRLRWPFRLAPARHYVAIGEANGLMPNPGFCPASYLRQVPAARGSALPPLWHHLRHGGRFGSPARPGDATPRMPAIAPGDRPARPRPYAVALHLYYPDLWPECAAALQPWRDRADLFVTLGAGGDPDAAALAGRIRRAFPAARVWTVPNHGRDVLPFLHLAGAGLFRDYRAVCKIHGKRSPHRADGAAWRRRCIGGLLGAPDRIAPALDRFASDPRAGLMAPTGEYVSGRLWWGMNRARAEALMARGGHALPAAPGFPAGSMFWIRPPLLEALAALGLGAEDFEPEDGRLDGTTAHAMERVFGLLAPACGLTLREVADFAPTPLRRAG